MCSLSPLNYNACTCVCVRARMCSWQQVQLSPPHFLNCPLASAVLSAAASLCFRKPVEENKARASSCVQRRGRSNPLQKGKPGLVGTAGGSSTTSATLEASKKSLNNLADWLYPVNVYFTNVSCIFPHFVSILWLELPLNGANIACF